MDRFEKELSDAFTEMILSGWTSDGASGVGLSTESTTSVAPQWDDRAAIPADEPEREAATSTGGEVLAEEVNELLASLRSSISSGDLNQAIQPLVSIMGKLMDMIPSSAQHQLPAAVLPDFSHNNSRIDGAADGSRPALYDVKQHSFAQFKDSADYATRAFRTFDTAQECLEDPSRLSIPSSPPPGTSSSASSAAAQDGLSWLGSMMNKLYDSFGGNQMSKEMSRILQGNEAYLRTGARELARSLQSTPESSPYYPVLQSAFALVLLHLYELTHDSTSLDAAIDTASRGVSTLTDPRSGFPPAATFAARNWTYSQRLFSRREGSAEPLDRAINVATTILGISSEHHPNDFAGRRLLSMELAECLLDRHRHLGDVKDLDHALNHIRAAFKDVELEDTHSLYVLGSLHLERYARRGTLDDLDKALYHAMQLHHLNDQSSLNGTTLLTPHPDAAPSMHLLAAALVQRFIVVMDVDVLNEAVTYGRKAVQLCPQEHPHYSMYLSDIASLLHQRFVADDDLEVLEDCVQKALEALNAQARPGCYPYYPQQAVLGLALARLGGSKNDVEQIDEGIHHLTVARKNFSGGPHLESRIEQDLASALLLKFEHTNAKDDLDEAVHYASSALERAPTDDSSRAGLAFELGRMLSIRYSISHIDADLERAVDTLRDVSNGTGPASTRVRAAMGWAKVAAARGAGAASLTALKVALDILPLVAWSGNRMVVQYKTLMSLSADIGPWAAACAISCGKLEDAVLYLERGRNVLWSQLLAFQDGARKHRAAGGAGDTSTSTLTMEADSLASYITHGIHGPAGITEEHREELKKRNPQLHGILENLLSLADEMKRKAASMPVHRPEDTEKMDEFKASFRSIYGDALLHGAARRWTSLRSTVEDLGQDSDGLDLFVQDSPLVELLVGEYVVFLNTHSIRCDALIMRRTADASIQVDHVPLPELCADIARQWAESIQIGMYDLQAGAMGVRELENIILIPILQELWRTAASPVLTHLSISADTASPPTRIWWCLSGPLAFLPLHAAGPYNDGAPGVPELVISSYTPTLKSLLNAYKAPRAAFSMLAVGQPDTPDMSPLPSVRKELATIERACARVPRDLTALVGPDATVLAVSHALSSHTWLHLSCHAHQDSSYPFDSAFYMHNGPLTLKRLMQLDLARVQFAFLSACLTSAGDAGLPDECIHLAAGMQFAGVRSAVATLWSVDDRAAALVTDRVYGKVMKEGVTEPDAGEAARALHDAVLERKAAGKPMVGWVPFIHVGI